MTRSNGNWSGEVKDINQLHCLAIVKQRDILSLRNVTDAHSQLLRSILTKRFETIEQKYGILRSRVRAYVHYHPTFWHLHVHFKLVENIGPYEHDRIHSIFSILQNVRSNPKYYQSTCLQISVPL